MSNVLQQILEWSRQKKRPMWQRDALRRIVEKGVLTEQDIAELVSICREGAGGVPLDETHLPSSGEDHDRVALLSVKDIQNINALAPGSSMEFGETGLTVIYGDNASGKSGYSRILKQVCRTRERAVLHPNIFVPQNDAPQKATLRFSVNGVHEHCEWTAGTPAPQGLGKVSVFDARCGEYYVDQRNPVEFVPFGLDLFDKLADTCRRVEEVLQREADILARQEDRLEDLKTTTLAANFIQNLRPDTAEAEIAGMGTLTETEKDRDAHLAQQIGRIHAQDPKKKRMELDRKVVRLRSLLDRLREMETALSPENVQEIRKAQEELSVASRAAKVASEETFGASVLDGVGTEVWRKLWEAARTYSSAHAYPAHEFPVTEEGARCVLCQQKMADETRSRMDSFAVFVQGAVQKAVEDAQRTFDVHRKSVTDLLFEGQALEQTVEEVESEDTGIAHEIRAFLDKAKGLRDSTIKACRGEEGWKETSQQTVPVPADAIQKLIDRFNVQSQELARAENPQELAKMETEFADLRAKLNIGKAKERILKELERRGCLQKLEQCLKFTDTHVITSAHTRMGKEHINDKLCCRFQEELKKLHVQLKVELECSGERGGSRHRILLRTTHEGDFHPSQILSEGEHRCVAIASFLSELATTEQESAIVFDDPTSSLDHKWQEPIARRLVEEARKRQVIVFTHDIIFLLFLQESVSGAGIADRFQYVCREPEGTGVCMDGLPFEASSTESMLRKLRPELQKLGKLYNEQREREYKEGVHVFYSRLRSAWERAVEEKLLNCAVQRFSREVMTQRLKKIGGDVLKTDCERVEKGMTKCSRYTEAHSAGAGLNPAMPPPQELETDLNALFQWVEELHKRR